MANRVKSELLEAILRPEVSGSVEDCLLDTQTIVIRFTKPLTEIASTPEPGTPAFPWTNVFRRVGRVWHINFQGNECFIPDMRGLLYIHHLLSHPSEEIYVDTLTLAARKMLEGPSMSRREAEDLELSPEKDLGEVVDAQALSEARERLDELEGEIHEAEVRGDEAAVARLTGEKSQFVRYLAEAVGLKGKPRKAGSRTERNRQACRSAIVAAVGAIERENKAFGEHLRKYVRTGFYCRYAPADSIWWQL